MTTSRWRIAILLTVVVVAVVGSGAYLLRARSKANGAKLPAPTSDAGDLATVMNQPHIIFRNTALGNAYGMISIVPLSSPGGARVTSSTECDRVYGTTANVLCLSSHPGLTGTSYDADILNAQLGRPQKLPLTGIPSRARLSRDGTLAATTSFTAGDSYAGSSFSTRTVITRSDGSPLGDLEQFTLLHDGSPIAPIDRNYWGVTFASDDDTFYATVEWSGQTWLVRGSVSHHTMTTLHKDAECPSLSPDGMSIVFKQRGNLPAGKWRLVRYDVASGAVTPLAETRSVDDQVEWLNDRTVIYGVPRTGTEAAVDDVWAVPADGSGTPHVLIFQAWSPAVVR